MVHTKVVKYMYQFLKENICATICFFPLFFFMVPVETDKKNDEDRQNMLTVSFLTHLSVLLN